MKTILNGAAKHMKLIVILMIVGLIVFPFFVTNSYILRIMTVCMMYVMLALSINLLTGFGGLMTMGHAAFWGIGAYTGAILATKVGLGMGVSMIVAAIIAGLFSLLLGLATLRLKGYFLTIVTLGFCEIVRLVELNFSDLTGGALGISAIPKPNLFGIQISDNRGIYYIMLGLVVLAAVVIFNIVYSRIGLAIQSVRDDDIAAAAMGVNVFSSRLIAFIVSAMLAGICGAFYAHYISYISPTIFTTNESMKMLIMTIFGGLGSIPGSIIGASILTVIPEAIRVLAKYRNLIYGVIIVVLMMVKPDGLFGSINFKYMKQRQTLSKEEKEEVKREEEQE